LYIFLGGHADNRGSKEYNLQLSAKRANNIKKILVDQGIDPKRINVYSYGKEFAQKGTSESIQRLDRRVDIQLWEAPPTKMQGVKEVE
jgi:peptidoglycan-associated lipoprotein